MLFSNDTFEEGTETNGLPSEGEESALPSPRESDALSGSDSCEHNLQHSEVARELSEMKVDPSMGAGVSYQHVQLPLNTQAVEA